MDLLKTTKQLCRLYDIKPARSRGQNFLIKEEVYEKIVEAAELKKDDIVLRDGMGIIASVLYGPDNRTKIIPISKNIIYMAYFTFAVTRSEIIIVMADLAKYLRICECPHANIERMKIY